MLNGRMQLSSVSLIALDESVNTMISYLVLLTGEANQLETG